MHSKSCVHGKWLEEMGDMVENTVNNLKMVPIVDETGNMAKLSVNGLSKDSCTRMDTRNVLWLEEVGDMIENAVNNLKMIPVLVR
jgi:hypothetical protein